MSLPDPAELVVVRVPSKQVSSPYRPPGDRFVDDHEGVLVSSDRERIEPLAREGRALPAFERAGPRRTLFTDPRSIGAGLVTCGGICPGLNNVIRSIVLTLTYGYAVPRVLGFRNGFAGLSRKGVEPRMLVPDVVEGIHRQGGTILGSSRGPQDPSEMVDTLVAQGVSVLFTIGGDGTMRGASAIAREVARRGLAIAVIGVPKTIDNDILWIEGSFGFRTAVDEAVRAIGAAHVEARGAADGIGLVKLMGRHAGFIAAHATLASADVNFCLVPEVPFALDRLLHAIERRLDRRDHAVIVVAEGAGQDLLPDRPTHRDPSGNPKLGDIGNFLRERIESFLRERGRDPTLKYIDPSYMIRSVPADALDAELCVMLGQHAVHAAMAGKTNVMIGRWSRRFTHVPIELAVRERHRIEPEGALWQRVIETTGQPADLGG